MGRDHPGGELGFEPLVYRFLAAVESVDARAGPNQPANRGEADPAAATCDDGDLAAQGIELVHLHNLLEERIRVSCGRGPSVISAGAGCAFAVVSQRPRQGGRDGQDMTVTTPAASASGSRSYAV